MRCVTCNEEKPLPYKKGDGRECQNCHKKAKRLERGLQKPGRKPKPDSPYSRYNPTGNKVNRGINGRREFGGTCKYGHLLDEENAYFEIGTGYIKCRRCQTNKNRERVYGLTPEQYKELLETQDGHCALCESTDLVVDHDHVTGATRGLLCGTHNKGLGMVGDTVEALERALDYLRTVAVEYLTCQD